MANAGPVVSSNTQENEKGEQPQPGIVRTSIHDSRDELRTLHEATLHAEPNKIDAKVEDDILVDWEPNDPDNPQNWSYRKKWIATIIVSAFTFISPVASSMVAPAADQINSEFNIGSSALQAMVTSIFVLGYAIGPLFWGPLSEVYGRSFILQISNVFFLLWNIGCGLSQNLGQLIAFRLLAGLGGSAPLAIVGAVVGDVWSREQRGQATALYSLAPLLGPVLGPLTGSWVAQKSNWRWVFWSTSIVDGFIQLAGLFFLKETFAPLILQRRAKKIRKELGSQGNVPTVRTPFDGKIKSVGATLALAFRRPFQLFAQEPIIQLFAIYLAFIYGLIYLMLTTIPTVFQDVYGESVGIAGLNYIGLGLGMSGLSQLNARLMDRTFLFLKKKYGTEKPEFRLPSMVPGTIFIPAGLLIFGWTVTYHKHWVAPDIGLALIGGGMMLNFQAVQTYIIDCFTLHAASALAAVTCLRSLAGFGLPLLGPTMYKALGYGVANSILAGVAIIIGVPAPWIFWRYGEAIRARSRNAARVDSPQPRGTV